MKKTYLFLLLSAFLCSCSSVPQIVPGKGAVYGTVTANSHKEILAKASKKKDSIYSGLGGIIFTEQMVNYPELKEIFVCLVSPSFRSKKDHLLIVNDNEMSHRSLAIGVGDRLAIQNNSTKALTFFIAGKDDDIQIYSPIKPGERSSLVVEIEGDLELGSDENEALQTTLLARKGLIAQQHASGDSYSFENLYPGNYKILFWFWRLGLVEKSINIKGGENIQLNQILSVDKIMDSRNEP
jgi:hypothetical protein